MEKKVWRRNNIEREKVWIKCEKCNRLKHKYRDCACKDEVVRDDTQEIGGTNKE